MIEAIQSGDWLNSKALGKSFASIKEELSLEDGALMRIERPVIPEKLRNKALTLAHIGHPGIVVMKRTLRRAVWWPGLDRDVENFCENCDACILVARKGAPEPMVRSDLPERPWQHLATDFYDAGGEEKKLSVMVVKDYYTRYMCCSILDKKDASEVTKALTTIFSIFGYPDSMKMDNGPPFTSEDFKAWNAQKGIKI